MAQIHVLDKHVAELIAAGEVVERPASVIKELVENTIDAGAKHVTVEIKDGGVTYMRITDDGCGMHREDVPTAFLRHATSKVRSQEDLNAIGTLGFRGEALASVAAVAKVDLTTCAKGEIEGTHYAIHGGEEMVLEDAGCAEGSTFIVEDLFYNVPARMKFLKKDVSEGNAVAGVVERLALSHPDIAMRFIRDGRTELQTPGDGNLLNCIHAVFGKSFAATLIPVDYTMSGVTVSGYICKPEGCRPNRTMQHYFVNNRYVKTQTAMIAMERAYKGVMMVGRFPACVLSVDLPAETVDANVHPAKIEVRFVNEKPVFDAVYYGVKSALESRDTFHRVLHREEQPPVAARPIEKTENKPAITPVTPTKPTPIIPKREVVTASKVPSFLDMVVDDKPKTSFAVKDGTGDEPIPLGVPYVPKAQRAEPVVATPPPADIPEPIAAAPPAPEPESAQPMQTVIDITPAVRLVGEVFSTYILAEMGDSLYLIDKHAAHERILYNKLRSEERTDEQMLLAPVTVTVSHQEHTALMESLEELRRAGIEMEDFGGQSVLVRSFPMVLAGEDIEATVREIAGGLHSGGRDIQTAKLDWIYHSTACRAAVKAGDISRPAELENLIKRVLLDDEVRYCPHGRPVCVEFTRKELEKEFGRIT